MYCSFPRGDRRRGSRREEEEQGAGTTSALLNVCGADALDRADYGRRRECIRRVCFERTLRRPSGAPPSSGGRLVAVARAQGAGLAVTSQGGDKSGTVRSTRLPPTPSPLRGRVERPRRVAWTRTRPEQFGLVAVAEELRSVNTSDRSSRQFR